MSEASTVERPRRAEVRERPDGTLVVQGLDLEGRPRELSLLEVSYVDGKDTFLCIRETLTRMGRLVAWKNELHQSCHILHKRARIFIVHFKEMLALDGRRCDISDEDVHRRNHIAGWLDRWDLCRIKDADMRALCIEASHDAEAGVEIVKHRDKGRYKLVPKYTIGKKGRDR